ncbi:hypothetical protein SAMN02745129_2274 [Ferrimonas marina]|uniref:Uncharacterized protein n=2 Tax=Ferrimonas marina TaxID=299255 RepID=A0A1M5TTK8_9GAMM|nr:hypothetical protein SAMN02745129_2274 [Ferrimonas marina]
MQKVSPSKPCPLAKRGLTCPESLFEYMREAGIGTKSALIKELAVGTVVLTKALARHRIEWTQVNERLAKEGLCKLRGSSARRSVLSSQGLTSTELLLAYCRTNGLSSQAELAEVFGVGTAAISADINSIGISWGSITKVLRREGLCARRNLAELPWEIEQALKDGAEGVAKLCSERGLRELRMLEASEGVPVGTVQERLQLMGIGQLEVGDHLAVLFGDESFGQYWRVTEMNDVIADVIEMRCFSLNGFCTKRGYLQSAGTLTLKRWGVDFVDDVLVPAALEAPGRLAMTLAIYSDRPGAKDALKQVGWSAVEDHARAAFSRDNWRRMLASNVGKAKVAELKAWLDE